MLTDTIEVGRAQGSGRCTVERRAPSDKAILQRVLVISAMASGLSRVEAVLDGSDVRSALACVRALGVDCRTTSGSLIVAGAGLRGLCVPGVLDVGNSATAARLFIAVLAGQPGREGVVTGNSCLRSRPMSWLIEAVRAMGGDVQEMEDKNRLPVRVSGRHLLTGTRVVPAVHTAQAKSPVLIAGLLADGPTTVVQPFATRDHTQRLLRHFGVDVTDEGGTTTVFPPKVMRGQRLCVPGDVSAAAPFLALVAGLPHNGVTLRVRDVSLNPTRLGFTAVLRAMGADLTIERVDAPGPEPRGDIIVRSGGDLQGVDVRGGELVQSMIDEVPVLCAIAAVAEGTTRVTDCRELRDKDTDRLRTTLQALRPLGVKIDVTDDTVVVTGDRGRLTPGRVPATGDHRVTMAAATLAALLPAPSVIHGARSSDVSYAGFFRDLAGLADVRLR